MKQKTNHLMNVCIYQGKKPVDADNQKTIKRFSNAQARLALKGYVTESGGSAGFIVTRYGLSRWLPSIEALERYVAEVGA